MKHQFSRQNPSEDAMNYNHHYRVGSSGDAIYSGGSKSPHGRASHVYDEILDRYPIQMPNEGYSYDYNHHNMEANTMARPRVNAGYYDPNELNMPLHMFPAAGPAAHLQHMAMLHYHSRVPAPGMNQMVSNSIGELTGSSSGPTVSIPGYYEMASTHPFLVNQHHLDASYHENQNIEKSVDNISHSDHAGNAPVSAPNMGYNGPPSYPVYYPISYPSANTPESHSSGPMLYPVETPLLPGTDQHIFPHPYGCATNDNADNAGTLKKSNSPFENIGSTSTNPSEAQTSTSST
jgi:hypothetical protein